MLGIKTFMMVLYVFYGYKLRNLSEKQNKLIFIKVSNVEDREKSPGIQSSFFGTCIWVTEYTILL